MRKRSFLLTDFQDRTLAACDDMYLEAIIQQEIATSWYARRVTFHELRQAYKRLSELGLIRMYRRSVGRIRTAKLSGNSTRDLLVRATAKGRKYLKLKRHVA